MSFVRMPGRLWIVVVGALLLSAMIPAQAGWKEGTVLPDLAKFGLEGKLPADLAGKVLLVDFCAAWCGPCKTSFPALDDLNKRLGPRGLVVLAVSVDENAAALQKFLKEHPVSFPVVRDAAQKLVQAADVQAMPSSFLVDAKGKIRFAHTGFHGSKTAEEYAAEIETLLKEREAKP